MTEQQNPTAGSPPVARNAGRLAAGTVLIGASGYVFLALVGNGRFEPGMAAALSSTYLIISILGPGVFVATEQETSRIVSAGLADGRSPVADIRRLAVLSGVVAALALGVLAVFAPLLLDRVLRGQLGLILALAVSVIGSAWIYLVRGLAGGQHRFRRYTATLLVDGGIRLLGCVVLVVLGVHNPVPYGLALAAGPLVAALVTARGSGPAGGAGADPRADRSGPPQGWGVLSRGLGLLLVASLLAMLLANLSPVVLTAQLPGAPAVAFGFATAVVLTRIPLLAMGPIQALVLPRLASAAQVGRLDRFRADLLRGSLLVGGLGVVALAGVAVLGRWAIRLVYGAGADTTTTGVLVLLSLSALMLMLIQLLQLALIVLDQHRGLVAGWLVGGLVFTIALVLPLDPVASAVLAQLVGPGCTLAVHAMLVNSAMRRFRQWSLEQT